MSSTSRGTGRGRSGRSGLQEGDVFFSANLRCNKGRVRTGCLTCRSRKVKCDELRPSCQRCIKSNRQCTYKSTLNNAWPLVSPKKPLGQADCHIVESNTNGSSPWIPPNENDPIHDQPVFHRNTLDFGDSQASLAQNIDQQHVSLLTPGDTSVSPPTHPMIGTLPHHHDTSTTESSSRFEIASRDIYWTVTVDMLAACDVPPVQSTFSYFVTEVDCPILSPFDGLNWRRIKVHIARLGAQESTVSRAILAVQVLYRTQAYRLSMFHAISTYNAIVNDFESIASDTTVAFDVVMVIAFLLCISVVILPNEDGSALSCFNEAFVARLKGWLYSSHRSPVSLRIGSWLQILQVATKRGGSPGLLPEEVSTLLFNSITDIPDLSMLDSHTNSTNTLYDTISTPIFAFFLGLQRLSNRVSDLSHYKRSRVTPEDQEEVADILGTIKADMDSMWEARPGPLRLQPGEIRENFHRTIAQPLITLTGVCIAAFYSEIVAIGRTYGDPPFASPEAKQAMSFIRDIIDGDWNAISGCTINPGYHRPLFLYGIETLQPEETQWAIDRLRQIESPISRADFTARFVECLGEAQRNQHRRVTMKYFCYQTFGVPPPVHVIFN